MAQARNNLITEQTNLADSETNFLSAVGQMPDQLERPAPFMAMLPANLNEARQQMLENSPILRSAESDIAAAEKQYEAAKSTFYPRFDAELGRTADNDLDGQNGHNNEWQAMLRMRFNLYSGGSNKADLESKSYLANQALDIRNNALRQLNEELGLAWNALNNANAQVPIAQQYVDHSTACAPPTSVSSASASAHCSICSTAKTSCSPLRAVWPKSRTFSYLLSIESRRPWASCSRAREWSHRWHPSCRTM
jgi:adhesin transport system outer membrane protein